MLLNSFTSQSNCSINISCGLVADQFSSWYVTATLGCRLFRCHLFLRNLSFVWLSICLFSVSGDGRCVVIAYEGIAVTEGG